MKPRDICQAVCEKCTYYSQCYYDVDCEAIKILRKHWRMLNEDIYSNDTDEGDQ